MAEQWVRRWRRQVRKTKLPGVWALQTGGYYVRCKWKAKDGTMRELQRALPSATNADEARRELLVLVEQARRGRTPEQGTTPLFSEYSALVLESRVRSKRIKSPASVAKWQDTLVLHLLPVFGTKPIDEITHRDVLAWMSTLEQQIDSGEFGARTINTWIRVLKTIFKVGAPLFGFPNPTNGISQFPEVGRTYTRENPNALPPGIVQQYMTCLKREYPQHYAMGVLMLATGLRPSSIRPLRRKGAETDYCRETGSLEIRRSQVMAEPMNYTKTNRDQTIHLPPALREILNDHADELDRGDGPMTESDLLFPATNGGFRSRSVLDRPLRHVAKLVGLPFSITPKAFRRSFKNFTRRTRVDRVLERSVSGHHTEEMDHTYGFAFEDEQREVLGALLAGAGIVQKGVIRGGDRGPVCCVGKPMTAVSCVSMAASSRENPSK